MGAELIPDEEGLYTVIKSDTERVLFTGEGDCFGFYEGASLRKINGSYYILYPSDHGRGVHMMSYAIADHPLGPYRFGGDLLDNDGCDLRSGNNHGSFCEINGQWYLFYHRGFDNSDMTRRVCVEKIYVDEKGQIGDKKGGLVAMTNHGFGGPLDPYQKVEASYATHVRLADYPAGCYLTEKSPGLHPLVHITDGCCVEYRDFDFGELRKNLIFTAQVLPLHEGSIEVVLDTLEGPAVGTVEIPEKREGYSALEAKVGKITGIHTLYLRFCGRTGQEICELASFCFCSRE